jgi:hypothetical protein
MGINLDRKLKPLERVLTTSNRKPPLMSRDYMDPKNRLKNMVMANKNEIRRSKFKICLTILGILPFMAVSSSLAGKASLWLYSPDGVGNFQKLAIGPAMTNGGLIQLILADFNGDKTTDVFTTTPVGNAGAHQWMYSNGGRSDFIKIAVGPGIGNIAFGDFDGDGRTDVFATRTACKRLGRCRHPP